MRRDYQQASSEHPVAILIDPVIQHPAHHSLMRTQTLARTSVKPLVHFLRRE
jgi:hypothetical protein